MSKSLFLAFIYALAAAFWIFGSDRIVLWLGVGPAALARIQIAKDWVFVAVTALLLYLASRRFEVERDAAGDQANMAASVPWTTWALAVVPVVLVMIVAVLGAVVYLEVIRNLGYDELARIRWLALWIGFVLLFALSAGTAGIFLWWQNARSRFELEHLRGELERANLQHRYEQLAQQSLDVVLLLAEDGAIVEANDRVWNYYGYHPEELKGQHVRVLRAPPCRDAVAHDYRRVASAGGALFEVLHQRRDGATFPVEVSARPLVSREHRYFQSVVRDISERKQAEAALAERERRFRGTFEQAAVGIAHVAPDGRWLRVNDRLCAIFGYPRLELLQKTFQDITHPDDLDKDLHLVNQILSGQIQTYSMEKRYLRKDGAVVWIDLTVSLVRDASGQPEYFISVIDDITSRKLAEQRLARITRFYAALSLTSQTILRNDGTDRLFEEVCRIAVKCGDLKGAWIGLRDPHTQQLRVAAAYGELRGRLASPDSTINPGDAALPYRPAQVVLASGSHWVGNDLFYDSGAEAPDWQILMATAGVRSCAVFPLKRAGAVVGVLNLFASEPEFFDLELTGLLDEMVADVSFALDSFERECQRQQAETALRDSESHYRLLFEAHPVPMWVYDLKTLRFLAVNDAAIDHYGYSRAEFLAMTIADIRPPEDVPGLLESIAEVKEGLVRAEARKHCKKDGRPIDVEIVSHTLDWGGRRAKMIMAHDITAQLRIERELLLAAAVYEQSAEGILISDAENRIISVNRAFTRVTGYSLEDVRGQNPNILASGRHDREFYATMWAELERVGHWQGEIWNRRKNGENYPEWLGLTLLRDAKGRAVNYVGIFNDIGAIRANGSRYGVRSATAPSNRGS
ncbi:MAG: PAS domain S-box protein [Candidatus Competibacter sp.]|nr:PAS domain S-box protein [Candidatus Competibacter sp.]MDG4584753.1 PAS domain S-box protein [Candidatus Competibacter sp.]